ncbi:MAG: hypothetical protein HY513_05680 [Candidatus Aenigmarchaeota archaeon]|nr:hypothetical protein [Candidatus Aenigmarchaeota archaeon]
MLKYTLYQEPFGVSKMAGKGLGEWAYLISIVIAVLAGLATATGWSSAWVTLLLVILGVVVGLLNVTEKETQAFLIASIGLIVASTATFSVIPYIGGVIQAIVENIAVFVAPAAVIVAVKAVASLASNK